MIPGARRGRARFVSSMRVVSIRATHGCHVVLLLLLLVLVRRKMVLGSAFVMAGKGIHGPCSIREAGGMGMRLPGKPGRKQRRAAGGARLWHVNHQRIRGAEMVSF